MSEYVTISKLIKYYGNICAVDNLSLTVKQGEIFGLLGPNGAGKSTTIHILTTLAGQDKGTVTIQGLDTVKDSRQVKKIIGIVPQDIALHPYLTARENVCYFASLYGLKSSKLREAAARALEFTGLGDKAGIRMNRMSGGMKRRLNIACGIAHRPQLIVMDEPTVGVDAQSREHILRSIKILREEGATVIYTSHYMNEVEEICDRIAIMDHGKLIACGTKTELVSLVTDRKRYAIKAAVPNSFVKEDFRKSLKALPDVLDAGIVEDGSRITVKVDTSLEFDDFMLLLNMIKQYGLKVTEVNSQVPDLDSLFLALTGKEIR